VIVNNDAAIAERFDAIALPSITANFGAAKSANLALSIPDWQDLGPAYASAMMRLARALVAVRLYRKPCAKLGFRLAAPAGPSTRWQEWFENLAR